MKPPYTDLGTRMKRKMSYRIKFYGASGNRGEMREDIKSLIYNYFSCIVSKDKDLLDVIYSRISMGFSCLSDRERDVLENNLMFSIFDPSNKMKKSLRDIGAKYDLCAERIRQIKFKVLKIMIIFVLFYDETKS